MQMMCKAPYSPYEGVFVGCGGCLHCRVNKARVWQHRLLLEEMSWELTSFVTLTYDDEHLPRDGSVSPREMQLFLKRLRKRCEPIKIRFYGVGEYGDESMRPHYHLALFGVGFELDWCDSTKQFRGFSGGKVVEKSWEKGFVVVGDLTKDSARYMTNYVTKFMNFPKSKKLQGRHPEFARMSNRPGIGALAIRQVANKLLDEGFSKETIVTEFEHGRKVFPLGSYLINYLHELRGGDMCARDREVRHQLRSAGLDYCDRHDVFIMEDVEGSQDHDVDVNSRAVPQSIGFRRFVMDKSKAKRFAAERREPLFRKRRSI